MGGDPADKSKSGFEDIEIDGCDLYENEFYGALITGCWDEKATALRKPWPGRRRLSVPR